MGKMYKSAYLTVRMKCHVYFIVGALVLLGCESVEDDHELIPEGERTKVVLEEGALLSDEITAVYYFSLFQSKSVNGFRFEYTLDSLTTLKSSSNRTALPSDVTGYSMNYYTLNDHYTLYVQEIQEEAGINRVDSLWLTDSLAISANGKSAMIYRYEIENPTVHEDVSCFISKEFGLIDQLNSWDGRFSLRKHGKTDTTTISALKAKLRREKFFYQSKINAPTLGSEE